MAAPRALSALAARLRCPSCGASLSEAGRALACARGHRFDLARQGHVALLPPRRRSPRGDSPAMVAAREAFLGAGHFAPLAEAVTAAARAAIGRDAAGGRPVVDLGAGTGYHLSALLEELTDSWGIALDASRSALRRALRAHPRIAAIACDVWQELPVRDAATHLVVNVLAPRNGPEIARVLSPEGALVVVTPTQRHLAQLVPALGMLAVAADKPARLDAALSPHLRAVRRRRVEFEMSLAHSDVRALVAMGPSAHHVDAGDVERRLSRLPDDVRVTASLNVDTFRPASGKRR